MEFFEDSVHDFGFDVVAHSQGLFFGQRLLGVLVGPPEADSDPGFHTVPQDLIGFDFE